MDEAWSIGTAELEIARRNGNGTTRSFGGVTFALNKLHAETSRRLFLKSFGGQDGMKRECFSLEGREHVRHSMGAVSIEDLY